MGPKLPSSVAKIQSSFNEILEVPAHRVVNRNGILTGAMYFPPDSSMSEQLEKEGVKVKDGQVIEFDMVFWDPMTEL